jgi:5-methylcytosine-specific restriction endonuclease McrA
MTVLRAYTPDECGPDDYPRVWHTGLVPAEDAERGVFVGDYATHIRFEIDPVGTKGVPSVGIKDVVRMLADHRCVRCGHPYRCGAHGNGEWSFCDARCAHAGPVRDTPLGPEAQWRILTVHHRDGDKANCRFWNLAALCQRCHLQIQNKVQMARVWPWEHTPWFRVHAAGWYAWTYLGEDLTADEVIARLPELLALERMA